MAILRCVQQTIRSCRGADLRRRDDRQRANAVFIGDLYGEIGAADKEARVELLDAHLYHAEAPLERALVWRNLRSRRDSAFFTPPRQVIALCHCCALSATCHAIQSDANMTRAVFTPTHK